MNGLLTAISLVLLWTIQTAEADPCLPGAHLIISDGSRSISFKPGQYDSLLCDYRFITKGYWYRFKHRVGGMLPEKCVPLYHCGTQAPIWLEGKHPVDGEVVKRTVCSNFGYPNNCCSWSSQIMVKRCEDSKTSEVFYVYKLVQPPGCSMSYCSGNQQVCPAGRIFNNRTQICNDLTPTFSGVRLLAPMVEDNFVRFYCQYEYKKQTRDDGARFEVSFYFNHEKHPNATVIVSSVQDRAYLDEKWLRGNLGKSISCGVRAFWDGFSQYKTPEQRSNAYWAGIKVYPEKIKLSETDDKPEKIYLKSTIPITCKNLHHLGRCDLTLRVVTPTKRLVTTQKGPTRYEQCVYRISREDWKQKEARAYNISKPLEVMVTRDPKLNRASDMVLKFEPIPVGVPDVVSGPDGKVTIHRPIWDNYRINDIVVQVQQDRKMASCRSTSDPRMGTFDNWGYDILSQLGEFVLWRSKSSRNFEVHVRHWKCREAWFVACTCGVAVKEGNTVLAVDMCDGTQKGAPRPKVIQISPDELRGASVTRDDSGKSFSINMPSGAYVKMDILDWGMNVYAFAPSEDANKTEGLCGTYDGNTKNEFKLRNSNRIGTKDEFIQSWRIPKGASLFDKPPEPVQLSEQHAKFCRCSGGQISCDWTEKIDPINEVGKPGIVVNPLKHKRVVEEQRGRLKRSLHFRTSATSDQQRNEAYTDDVDDDIPYTFDYGNKPMPKTQYRWPTPKGIREAFARRYCEQAIRNDTAFKVCEEIGYNPFTPLQRCMEDIKVMDDLSYAYSAISENHFFCTVQAQQEGGKTSSTGKKISVDKVVKLMCPGQCSSRGKCVNGKCQCNNGYDGADCSLVKGQVPTVKYIPNRGLCDIAHRPCRRIRVIGTGIKDSPSLVCKVVQVAIHGSSKTTMRETTAHTNASMISMTEVACDLPSSPVRRGNPDDNEGTPVHGMLVSLSNDGKIFSKELFVTIYDSTCQRCEPGAKCTHKENSCLIRGHCFGAGEANPKSWCQNCVPNQNRRAFVTRQGNRPPVFTTPVKIRKFLTELLELQLEAKDPESRPLTYTKLFATSQTVTMTEKGFLRWATRKNQTVRLEVQVQDECNARAIRDFELKMIPCPCKRQGTCVPAQDKPRGQGFFKCACPPGYTGNLCETEIDECASSPCLHGICENRIGSYYCHCRKGYRGGLCDEIVPITEIDLSGKRPTGPSGVWSNWGEFGQCSHHCDYGIRTRQRKCNNLPCDGPGSQTKECNAFNCREPGVEKNQGIILILQDTSIVQVRMHEVDILDSLAEAVNRFCKVREHAEQCCHMVGLTKIKTDLKENVVLTSEFKIAGGYPKRPQESVTYLKLIGSVNRDRLSQVCKAGQSGKRSVRSVFIDPKILKSAANNVIQTFETDYGITVKSIKLPHEMGGVMLTAEKEKSGRLWIIIGASGGVVVVVLLVIIVVLFVRTRSTKMGPRERSNSRKYLTNNEAMDDTIVDTKEDQPSAGMTDSKQSTVNDKFFYRYQPPPPEPAQPTESDSRQSTVKGQYFYKYAQNEGLGQMDAIDSSQLYLTGPKTEDTVAHRVSSRKVESQNEHCAHADGNTSGGNNVNVATLPDGELFRGGPKRMSVKQSSKVYAWKLFSR